MSSELLYYKAQECIRLPATTRNQERVKGQINPQSLQKKLVLEHLGLRLLVSKIHERIHFDGFKSPSLKYFVMAALEILTQSTFNALWHTPPFNLNLHLVRQNIFLSIAMRL